MSRQRRARPVSGILLLDKPRGLSSNRALQRAKRLFNAAKAGHTGSLDPLASGVLPLCFGEATKFSGYLLNADKSYDSRFCLGEATSTGDAEGATVRRADAARLTADDVARAARHFRGDIEQIPPMHSAIKRGGQPLYKLARAGVEVERKARAVRIERLEITAFAAGNPALLDVSIDCTKGTYVRSLAMDLGHELGVGGHVQTLRRTAVGPFAIADCVGLEALETLAERDDRQAMDGLLRPVDEALAHIPLLRLAPSSGFYLRRGQPVLVPNAPCDGMVRIALETGEFLGIGEILGDGRVAPRRLVASGS